MAIHNGIGITSYQRSMDSRIAGTPAASKLPTCRPYTNPRAQQVTEFTVTGTAADGDYTINVREPDGTVIPVTFTRGSGESNDAISDGLLAQFEALIGSTLAGIVESAEDSDTNDVQATFEHEGIAYTFTVSAPSGADIDVTEITSPNGSSLPLGRFLADGGASPDGGRRAVLPSGVAETAIVAFLMRPLGVFVNGESTDPTADDVAPAGAMIDGAFDGEVNVYNAGGDAVRGGQVHVVVNTAGNNELGQARGSDDGANSVTLPLRNAYWTEDTPAGQVGPIMLRL